MPVTAFLAASSSDYCTTCCTYALALVGVPHGGVSRVLFTLLRVANDLAGLVAQLLRGLRGARQARTRRSGRGTLRREEHESSKQRVHVMEIELAPGDKG